MSNVEVTQTMANMRDDLAKFAALTDVPPDIRECLIMVLREYSSPDLTDEQLGWAVLCVSGALFSLASVSVVMGTDPGQILSPHLLGLLCSAGEAFVSNGTVLYDIETDLL